MAGAEEAVAAQGAISQSLFDLELDTEKNQYETGQTASSSTQHEQDIDDALKKLDELARRQQDLANQQRNTTQTTSSAGSRKCCGVMPNSCNARCSRWPSRGSRASKVNRDSRAQQGANKANKASKGTGYRPSGQAGAAGSQGGQSGNDQQRIQQALDRVRQAQEDMARAASPEQSQAAARRAADRLREATDLMNGMRQQASTGRLDSFSQQAERLAAEQRDQATVPANYSASRMGSRMASRPGASRAKPAKRTKRSKRPESRRDTGGSGTGFASGRRGKIGQQQQLADDRQRMGEELARLEKQMQDDARQLAGGQQPASTKLREAVSAAEQADLQNRIKRSAEGIRRGVDPNSDATEAAIAAGWDDSGNRFARRSRPSETKGRATMKRRSTGSNGCATRWKR